MNSLRGTLPLALVKADPGLQMRAATDHDYCDELAALLKADADFELPEAVAFEDATGTVWLADGFHRHEGYRLAGRERLPVRVKKGSRDDAIAFAIAANETHGMRRSPADRRRAVQVALQHPVIGKKPLREVARLCGGVSWELVKRVQEELQGLRPVADGSSRGKAKPSAAVQVAGGDGNESIAPGPCFRPGRIACTDCDQSFDRQVWHCPGCGQHWLPEQEACDSCEAARPMPAEWYSQAATAMPVAKASNRSSARRVEQPPAETPAATVSEAPATLPMTRPPEPVPEGIVQTPRPGPPEPITEQVCDVLGRPVPDGLVEVFLDVREFRSIVQQIGSLKSRIEELRQRPGGVRLHRERQTVAADLQNAQSALRFSMPYAVCPVCHGNGCKDTEKGSWCNGTGWIVENAHKQLPSELKAICDSFRQAG